MKRIFLFGSVSILITCSILSARAASPVDMGDVSDVLGGQRTLYRLNDLGIWANGVQYGFTMTADGDAPIMSQIFSSQEDADFMTTGLFGVNGNFEVLVSTTGKVLLTQNGQTKHQAQIPNLSSDYQVSHIAAGDLNGDGYSELAFVACQEWDDCRLQYAYPDMDKDGNFTELKFAGSAATLDRQPTPGYARALLAGNFGATDTGELLMFSNPGDSDSWARIRVCAYDPSATSYFKCYDDTPIENAIAQDTALLGQFDDDGSDDELFVIQRGGDSYYQVYKISYADDSGTSLTRLYNDMGDPGAFYYTDLYQVTINGRLADVVLAMESDGTLNYYCPRLDINSYFYPDTNNRIFYLTKMGAEDSNVSAVFFDYWSGEIDFDILTMIPNDSDLNHWSLSATKTNSLSLAVSGLENGFQSRPYDFQKRSLLLGAPVKIRINSVRQPKTIIGSPPMHVDYIQADLSSSGMPKISNFSVFPANYNVGFNFDSTSANTNETKSQASHSYASSNTVGASVSFKGWGASVGTSLKASAKSAQKNTVENQYVDTTSTSYSTNVNTGFHDFLWFTEKDMYLYYYPVIALKALEEGEAQKAWLGFSAPQTDTFTTRITGDAVEWYQPIHEPGNVLSYPSSRDQIEKVYPDIDLLSKSPTWWYTDNSQSSVKVSWSNSSQSSQSVGSTHTKSCSAEESVHAGVSVSFFGFGFSESFSYSHSSDSSSAVSKMVTGTSSTSSSEGVTVTKNASFPQPALYSYGVQTYISGEQKPENMFDDSNTDQDVNTYGPLRVMFSADPQNQYSGSFWSSSDYAHHVDIALNHPTRWNVPADWHLPPSETVETSPTPTLNEPLGTNFATPQADLFYHMKGLFITKALDNMDYSPLGLPKRLGSQATVMDYSQTYAITARVYNYSLKATDEFYPGSVVKVAILGCKWDEQNAKMDGGSFLINDSVQEIASIPGHGNGNVNWAYASVNFDPKNYLNDYLVFWVVAWLEDKNGKLLSELPGHGLKNIPVTHNLLGWWYPSNPSKVETEDYSNNVGFYNQPIKVYDPRASNPGNQMELMAERQEAQHFFAHLSVNDDKPKIGDRVVVTADLQAGARDIDGVNVYFYDGSPEEGGRLLDIEHAGHIAQGEHFRFQTVYYPRLAGDRTIYVKAIKTNYEEVESSVNLTVRYDGGSGCFLSIIR